MKKGFSISFICLLALGFLSCEKTKVQESFFTQIEGTWRLEQTATDDNANGQLDLIEQHDLETGHSENLVFLNDTLGVLNVQRDNTFTDYYFKWSFMNHGYEDIRRIFMGSDIIDSHVYLTSTFLILRTSVPINQNTSVLSWNIYKKKV